MENNLSGDTGLNTKQPNHINSFVRAETTSRHLLD